MYGRSKRKPVPIYGISKKLENQKPITDCTPICNCDVDIFALTVNLKTMVDRTNQIVLELFPTIGVKAVLVASMKATAKMTVNTYVWLAVYQYFSKHFPGIVFDVHDRSHLAILKDTYLMHGFPWEDDPILRFFPL